MLSHDSFATPWTVAGQTSGISQSRILERVATSSSRDRPNSEVEPMFPASWGGFLLLNHKGGTCKYTITHMEQKTLQRIAIQAAHAAQYHKNK